MLTATMTPVTTRRREVPERIEIPARLPSKLHDVLWYIENVRQCTGFSPTPDEICQVFQVPLAAAAEMVRVLCDKGLVFVDNCLRVRRLSEAGRIYCHAYAPA